MLEWLFRNRQTGEMTVAQVPNASLSVVLVVWAGRRLFHPTGTVDHALAAVQAGALIWWGGDELIRGVNPWRRMLGAGALVWEVVAVFSLAV